jgi:hypothetical protein
LQNIIRGLNLDESYAEHLTSHSPADCTINNSATAASGRLP